MTDSVLSWAILTAVSYGIVLWILIRAAYEDERREEEDRKFWEDWERINYDRSEDF